MSHFGNRALIATPYEFGGRHTADRRDPEKPLRTHSLLHIAVARGDVPEIEANLAAGIPIDLLASDGLAPLHWALARDDLTIMALLLERGSPVDVRLTEKNTQLTEKNTQLTEKNTQLTEKNTQSAEGATPLMNAVQTASLEKASFLLDHGADANARDRRGFTALHRAAEMGYIDLVKVLLEHGAISSPASEGHTPRSLAEARGETAVVALLSGRS